MIMEESKLSIRYNEAADIIKTTILQSQYQAIKLVNREQLALYYGVGRYISQNSRNNFWGTSAIDAISEKLRRDLPGLRGFSATNLKYMRIFYEGWQVLDGNSSVPTDELEKPDNELLKTVQLELPIFKDFPIDYDFWQ